jgi:superfamily II DNA helicase RecQ
MPLQYKFFLVPVSDSEDAELQLNRFLRTVKVVNVQKEFVAQPHNAFWCLAVEYLSGDSASGAEDGRLKKSRRIDYKDILSPEDFALFVKLRELRKKIAADEAVPVYTIFTNEQLAQISKNRATDRKELMQIDGIGEARAAKYGEQVAEMVKQASRGPAGEDEG